MLVSRDYPYLQVEVTVRHSRRRFRALLDTEFDGYVVLPASCQRRFGEPDFSVPTRLADGTEEEFPAYRGGIEVVGLRARIVYLAEVMLLGNECLVGQGITALLKVTFDHGLQVVIEQ